MFIIKFIRKLFAILSSGVAPGQLALGFCIGVLLALTPFWAAHTILFLLLLWRGIRAARRAPDLFGFLLAFGISFMIFSVGFIHMSVNCVLLPTTGMPLPFISYGGSSILCTLAGIGILLNISKQAGQCRAPESNMRQRLKAICQ